MKTGPEGPVFSFQLAAAGATAHVVTAEAGNQQDPD
jgi:hypothetical protein